MKIKLAENHNEITLEQFQLLDKLNNSEELKDSQRHKEMIQVFTDIPAKEIDNIVAKDSEWIVNSIMKAIKTDGQFKSRFKIDGKEFGFIPNLDEITAGELGDLSNRELMNEDNEYAVEELHRVMAILFRPVTTSDSFKNYQIEPYKGSGVYAQTMLKMPLSVVNGALGFFLDLGNDLSNYTLKFIKEEAPR